MIYTCNLQMKVSLKIISILILVVCLASAVDQDPQQPTAAVQHSQPVSAGLSSNPQVASPQPQTTSAPENATNTPNPATNNPNIVTDKVQPSANPINQQHHTDTKVTNEQHSDIAHEQHAEHHDNQTHNDKIASQELHKMISQMSEEQLAAFQDTLDDQAYQQYTKLLEEEAHQEHQQQGQYAQQYNQIEEELTETQIEQAKEQEEFQKQQEKFSNSLINFNQYLFELDGESTQDFRFSISNAQQIIFHGYTYENTDGVYSVTSDVQEQDPIKLYVYENNHNYVYQKQFYFKYYGSFMGKQNSTYIFHFDNPSDHKLIALNIGVLFETGHVANKLTASDVANHSRRIQIFKQDISNHYTDMSMKSVLENQNRENLLNKLDRYYIYSIVELVILLVLCLVQVEFVKKLLCNTSNIV